MTNWKQRAFDTQAEFEKARQYLASVYMNTGCDEDEAQEFAQNFHAEHPDQIYGEACRYEDM